MAQGLGLGQWAAVLLLQARAAGSRGGERPHVGPGAWALGLGLGQGAAACCTGAAVQERSGTLIGEVRRVSRGFEGENGVGREREWKVWEVRRRWDRRRDNLPSKR